MIGSNGIPLSVLCYETTSEALHNKINEILDKFKSVTNGKILEKSEKLKKTPCRYFRKTHFKMIKRLYISFFSFSVIKESIPEPKAEKNGVGK